MRHPGLPVATMLSLSLLACGAQPASGAAGASTVPMPGDPVALEEIRVNPAPLAPLTWNSGYDAPQRAVVRSPEAWAAAWATIWARQSPAPALPAVDFTREIVLLAASGVQATGGVQVAIPNAAVDQGTLRVGVLETFPGAGCAVAAVVSSPVSAVRMARHDGPVSFVEARTTKDCP